MSKRCLEKWRRNEDNTARGRYMRAEEKEASKTVVVPGITIGDWACYRATLVGNGFGMQLPLFLEKS